MFLIILLMCNKSKSTSTSFVGKNKLSTSIDGHIVCITKITGVTVVFTIIVKWLVLLIFFLFVVERNYTTARYHNRSPR